MKKISYILALFILLSACGKHKSTGSSASDKEALSLTVEKFDAGQYVLAPAAKFYDKFDIKDGENNFLVYSPQQVVKDTGNLVVLQAPDTLMTIDKSYVVSLPEKENVAPGDFVLSWWQDGNGVQRAYILEMLDTLTPKVRYLDFESLLPDITTDYVGSLQPSTYRKIKKPLDPGSSVAYKDGYSYKWFMVLKQSGDSILAIDWSNHVQYLDTAHCLFNSIDKELEKGQDVWVPVFGIYTYGTVMDLGDGYATVVIDFLGESKEVLVPLLDVRTSMD